MPLAPEKITDLHERLCGWFAEEQRDLPWRRTSDPYAIWISEAMLQQTRVEAVLGHYARFLERLPNVERLAHASDDEVVALWSGLGYYRRARSLHAAAKQVVERHAGVLPDTLEAFLALPGVGPYTAGAVLSIAFQRSAPLVDGNVARVFARLFGVDDPPGGPRDRRLWSIASELVPAEPAPAGRAGATGAVPRISPGNWNQALMELGALVCTPRDPDCSACPLSGDCVALLTGRVDDLPRKAPRRAPVEVELELLLVEREGAVLLVRRDGKGRMAGLWELPTRELVAAPAGSPLAADAGTRLYAEGHLLDFRVEPAPLARLSHTITHHRIRGFLRRAALLVEPIEEPGGLEARWVRPQEADQLGLTGLTRKALRGRIAWPPTPADDRR